MVTIKRAQLDGDLISLRLQIVQQGLLATARYNARIIAGYIKTGKKHPKHSITRSTLALFIRERRAAWDIICNGN